MLELLGTWGYWGLFLGSFAAATVVPFSSDVLIIGILLAGGDPLLSFLSATLGNWLGGLTSFGIGWLGKWEWLEKWFHVKKETLEKQKAIIDRWGALLAIFSWLPVVGDVFAIGLGFYKVRPGRCAFWLLVGKALRYLLWIGLFMIFGENIPWL